MQEGLCELTVSAFLDRLGSSEPTPGGGAAAALVGSLAAGLGQMVCGLTIGKPKYAANEGEVKQAAERLARCRQMLMALIDGDAKAYAGLNVALKLDRGDPKRTKTIQGAALHAAAIPLFTARITHKVLCDVTRLREIGNRHLSADIESAVAMAQAAITAALANARANVPMLAPEETERVTREINELCGTS